MVNLTMGYGQSGYNSMDYLAIPYGQTVHRYMHETLDLSGVLIFKNALLTKKMPCRYMTGQRILVVEFYYFRLEVYGIFLHFILLSI